MTAPTLAARRRNVIIALLGVLLVTFLAVTLWILRSELSSPGPHLAHANDGSTPLPPSSVPSEPLPPSQREAIEEPTDLEANASSGATSGPEAAAEEERGPTFVILVRDRSTRADLHGIELRCI